MLSNISLFAQNTSDSLLLRKPISLNTIQYWKYMNKSNVSYAQAGIFFDVVKFPQDFYLGGFTYQMRGGYFPFYLDFKRVRNRFTFSEMPYPHLKGVSIFREGYDISFLIFQPFHYKRISEILVPYFGIGYQWSSVTLMEKGIVLDYSSRLNLSSWVWKAGLNLFIDNVPFNIILEYEQNIKPSRKFQVFSFGILVDISRMKKNKQSVFNNLIDKL